MPDETEGTQPFQGVRFEHRPDYLAVHIAAPRDNLKLAIDVWRQIAVECARHHYKQLLVIEDIQEILSTREMFDFAERMPELGFLGVTIAFVALRTERLAGYLFGETVATNRGIVVKVFDNVAAAEQWLKAHR